MRALWRERVPFVGASRSFLLSMNTRLFALVLAGTTSVLPALAQTPGKATPPTTPKAAGAAVTPKPATPAPATPAPATAAPATSAPVAPAPAGKDIAADVNGEKIALSDLNSLVNSFKASEPSLQTNSAEAQKAITQIRSQMLDDLIDTMLLAQEARRQRVVVAPATIDAGVAEVKGWYRSVAQRRNNIPLFIAISVADSFKNDADFQSWLKPDSKTPDAVRKTIIDELSIRELSTRLSADITVTNDDIATFYKTNLDQFTSPEMVRARHILLAVNPNSPPAEKERVKKRALDLIKQLKAGGNWDQITKNNSDDSNKDAGGDLGPFPRGMMVKEFEDAAFAAKPKDIVGPVATEYGFHIIRVDEKIPAQVRPLSEAQKDPELKLFLRKQKVEKKLDDSITALRAKAKIQKYI